VPSRPDHDQVGFENVAVLDDLRCGISAEQLRDRRNTLAISDRGSLVEHSLVIAVHLVRNTTDEAEAVQRDVIGERNDVHDGHARPLVTGEVDTELDRLVGGLRAVGCDQDSFHRGPPRLRVRRPRAARVNAR